MADPSPDGVEDQLRDVYRERQKFLTKVWKSGAGGKVYVVLFLAAIATPFLFELAVVVFVLFWIWPRATAVPEQVAVLAFVFVVLNAIALAVQRFAVQVWEYTRLMRTRRGGSKKGKGPPGEGRE